MRSLIPWIAEIGMLLAGADPGNLEDMARLNEMLRDRQHPRTQSQAALLLVQSRTPEAARIIKDGLQETEAPEVFQALAAALRLQRDARFRDELFAALTGARALVRQEAAETIALVADDRAILRLQTLAENAKTDLDVRQTAIWALGRSGRKSAVVVLLDLLSNPHKVMRDSAAEALRDLTGQGHGNDSALWRSWWTEHKDLSNETWLEDRLSYQAARARRLKGELDRARTQVVQLHQQLYGRLPQADKLGHVQALVEHEDAAVRLLAVTWSAGLLPSADGVAQRGLAEVLLRFSHDNAVEVQRTAVLGLGNVSEVRAFERLRGVLHQGMPPIRAAAARALVQQTKLARKGSVDDTRALQRQVVPLLQKALEDPALEVVVEAAEALGSLGLPEAVPVLTALLRHPSEPVRQTAAQALERIADPSVLNDLLAALDDSVAPVRFSLLGALGRAVADGRALNGGDRGRLMLRLEDLLQRDTDPGVRSRVATVLGECGTPATLTPLWKRAQAAEDARVQDKAWLAIINIIARAANLDLLVKWERTLIESKQGERRVQLLVAVLDAWKKADDTKTLTATVTELLVQAQLDQSKWQAAYPLVRELLKLPGADADVSKRLRWLLAVGEQALKEKNRAETLRVVQEAQALLSRSPNLVAEFQRLEKAAQGIQ